jgi:hypothetical protein
MAISLFNGYKVSRAGEYGDSGAVMTKSARTLNKFWSLLTVVVLSSATMFWLFWHYPVGTGIATLGVLTAFTVLIRLARSIDTDSMSELEHGKQGA